MQFLTIITILSGLAVAAPPVAPIAHRAVTSTAKSSSSIKASSVASSIKSSSVASSIKVSSVASSIKVSSVASSIKSSSVASSIKSSSVASSVKPSSVASIASSIKPSSVVSSVISIASSVKPSSIVSSPAATPTTTSSSSGSLLGINLGGSSSPLLGVALGSSTLLGVSLGSSTLLGVSLGSSTLLAVGGLTSPSQSPSVTASPTSTTTNSNPTFPATFTAPVQGSGVLTLDNLPALPPIIDATLAGVLGSVYGLMSGMCDASYNCNITVAGSMKNFLVNSNDFAGSASVVGWCDGGRCYGSIDAPISATSPFRMTCTTGGVDQACSATISGAVTAIFQNGQQVEAWGWLTPAGYCVNGTCTASIKAVGDPMYKRAVLEY